MIALSVLFQFIGLFLIGSIAIDNRLDEETKKSILLQAALFWLIGYMLWL